VLHLTEALPGEIRRGHARSTFDHVAFTCEDHAAATAQLKAHGIEHYIDVVPLIRQRQIFFSDPAGNGIELNCQLGPDE
jgi:glyoxylase I family protein